MSHPQTINPNDRISDYSTRKSNYANRLKNCSDPVKVLRSGDLRIAAVTDFFQIQNHHEKKTQIERTQLHKVTFERDPVPEGEFEKFAARELGFIDIIILCVLFSVIVLCL